MPSIINALTAAGGGVAISGDATGNLALQTAGNTAATINTSKGVQFDNCIGVGNATPSTSGAGITFPATQSASTDANTLDDYEEGTWTPKNSLGSNLPINNSATYIKIGKLVFINADINQLSQTSVYNLPFTSANTGYPGTVTVGYNSSYSTSPLGGIFNGNSTSLDIYKDGSTGITPSNGRFIISGCYVATA